MFGLATWKMRGKWLQDTRGRPLSESGLAEGKGRCFGVQPTGQTDSLRLLARLSGCLVRATGVVGLARWLAGRLGE